jgi:CRISPR-associated exonuclease Cas4
MDIDESEWVPISALEHWSYCPRQYVLIHVEATYDENTYTLRGRYTHERAHDEHISTVGAELVERGLPLCSQALGLTGKADVVEFHDGVPYPVEYKSGRDVGARHADIQLCAQAMCLEEMIGLPVGHGAVFHQAIRRRREVVFTEDLRTQVVNTLAAVRSHDWLEPAPPPVADARCRSCSLSDACLPFVVAEKQALTRFGADLYVVD